MKAISIAYGTTFRIYLLRVDEPQDKEEIIEKRVEGGLPFGRETILVVENDEEVRKVTGRILRMQGYKVLEAANPDIAFSTCNQHEGLIHLIITDVVMPELNGPELAKRLMLPYPDMKVLFMSGHLRNFISDQGILEKETDYIQKPFTVDELARKVREVLDK